MLTYIIMLFIVLFLILEILIGAKFQQNSNHFFNIENTNAMRGVWCIVIILVHTPLLFQNPIQDMIGSFAYIGVTFFFMTSSYGLSLSYQKNPATIKHFWRKRIPKLLIPCFFINLTAFILKYLLGISPVLLELIQINAWVKWLLLCYLFYWICHRFDFERERERDKTKLAITSILVILSSVIIYILKSFDIVQSTTWCTEVYGFVYGMILFQNKEKFINAVKNKWILKCSILCMLCGIVGIFYLKFKFMPVFGNYMLKILLSMFILLFILALNTRISIGNGISKFLGGISYEVYLIHNTIFLFMMYIFPNSQSSVYIAYSIIVTIFVASIVHTIDENIIRKINKLIKI